MKILFAGTPSFAAKHLEILLKGDHEIVSVLTQPDKRSGRGKRITDRTGTPKTTRSPG